MIDITPEQRRIFGVPEDKVYDDLYRVSAQDARRLVVRHSSITAMFDAYRRGDEQSALYHPNMTHVFRREHNGRCPACNITVSVYRRDCTCERCTDIRETYVYFRSRGRLGTMLTPQRRETVLLRRSNVARAWCRANGIEVYP